MVNILVNYRNLILTISSYFKKTKSDKQNSCEKWLFLKNVRELRIRLAGKYHHFFRSPSNSQSEGKNPKTPQNPLKPGFLRTSNSPNIMDLIDIQFKSWDYFIVPSPILSNVDLFLLLVQDGESNIATEFFGSSLIRSGIRSPNFQSKTEQRISCFYLLNKKNGISYIRFFMFALIENHNEFYQLN